MRHQAMWHKTLSRQSHLATLCHTLAGEQALHRSRMQALRAEYGCLRRMLVVDAWERENSLTQDDPRTTQSGMRESGGDGRIRGVWGLGERVRGGCWICVPEPCCPILAVRATSANEERRTRWMDGRMEGWTEGRKEGRKDGWMMDGWMGGGLGEEERGRETIASVESKRQPSSVNIRTEEVMKSESCKEKQSLSQNGVNSCKHPLPANMSGTRMGH
eukprot:84664-Rhodomonas_salina.1